MTPRTRRLAAATVLALAVSCAAGGTAAHAGPAWLKDVLGRASSADTTGTAGFDAQVVYARTELSVDARLRITRTERRVVRILRPAGTDHAAFAFSVDPGGRRLHLKAWSVGPQGLEETKDADILETTIAGGQAYSDVRHSLVRAPNPRVGRLAVVEFACEEPLPFATYDWYPQESELPVTRAEFAVELPAGWTLARHVLGCTPTESSDGLRRTALVVGPLPGFAREAASPPARSRLARVLLRFDAPGGGGAMRDWGAIAGWYHGLAAPHCAAAVAPPDLVALANARPPDTRLPLLAREVQRRIGYAAIELGDQRYEPDTASLTWTRRYGDCKDKATLLVAALGAVGIEACPALACTREAGEVDPDWPDPRQFNHCIVAIAGPVAGLEASGVEVRGRSGRTWTLFDPTDPDTPLGFLPWSLGGTRVVIADPAEGLVEVPRVDPGQLESRLAGRLAEDGAITGRLSLLARDGARGWLIARFEDVGEPARRERVAALFGASGLRVEATNVRWTNGEGRDPRLEADVRVAAAGRRAGLTWILSLPLPLLEAAPPADDSSRTQPYWLGWSPAVDGSLELEVPAGLRLGPRDGTDWSGAIGAYRLVARQEGERVAITRRYKTKVDAVPAAEWPALQELLRVAYRGDHAPLLLRAP